MTRASRALPILAVLSICACAHRGGPSPAPPPPPSAAPTAAPPATTGADAFGPEQPPPADDPFREVRADVDALLRAQAEALWAAWTRGESVDLARTYAGKEALFSADAVKRVRAAAQRASGDEQRALWLLHGFLAGEHLSRATASTAEKLARARAAATVTWDGQAVAADRVPALLAAEPDPARRAALLRAQGAAAARWAPLADALAADVDAAAKRLGASSAHALAAELRGESLEGLVALANEVLDATGRAYESVMGELTRAELRSGPETLRGQDVPRVLRPRQEPRLFPGPRLLPDARDTFAALGLDPEKRGVKIDAEARPRKDPRPLALPVEVPGDVRLSVVPGAGVADVRAILHEMAAATYYAHVESPRVEFRRLDAGTVRAWSLLFESVAGEPAWLAARTGDSEHHLAPIVRLAAARRLHEAREAAMRLLLELKRPKTAGEAAQVLERALAHPASAEEVALALADRDPLLQSADTLRSIVLAASLDRALTARAGGPWWKAPANGELIRRAFAEGSRLGPAALARAFGAPGLRASALADLAIERLRWAEER